MCYFYFQEYAIFLPASDIQGGFLIVLKTNKKDKDNEIIKATI